jgi:fatty acid desaturase
MQPTVELNPATPASGEATVLRPAVLAGPESLSSAARAQIRELSGHRPGRFLLELAWNWLVVAGVITLGVLASNVFVTVLCILLIGTRQMVFGLLLHEQVHRLGLRGKYGDWIVNVLAVYPLFATTVEDYAKVHLSHHKYFFTSKDPDFIRKSGEDWTFPADWKVLARLVLRDLTGLNTVALIKGKTGTAAMDEFTRTNPSPLWLRLGFYALVAVVLTLVGGWTVFLVYWVIPLLTITQLLVRWIAVIEHKYNMENATVYETTPLIRLKPWQRLLIPDLNFAMHAYHHAHPGVSFSQLPKVHEIYKREGLVDESAIFDGQGAYLKYMLKRSR